MKRSNIYKGVAKIARRLAASCLLLFFLSGSAWAQNDRQYVIEKDGHYLAHDGTTLQDATTFDPATCLWYSSNNYNYYFMVGTTRKYLKAPLALNGTLSVDDNPGTQSLNNSTLNYFFWDWDHGLARGVQHLEGGDCPYNSPGSQCWEVVWVSYEGGTWKMSSGYGYEPTANSARFLRVTITEHAEALSNEVGGVGNLVDFAMNYQDTHALDGTASALSCVYTPAYRQYHIDGLDDDEHNTHIQEVSYYYYGGQYHTDPPTTTTYTNATASGYAWSLSGDGAQYLSFNETNDLYTINGATPSVYYIHENTTTSHKLATLTLAVTYTQDDSQVTQTRTATVTVKIECQNPTVLEDNIVVTYVGATISWLPTADEYEVSWKKSTESNWTSVTVGNITSYTIRGLEFGAEYNYKVQATCDSSHDPTVYSFTTLAEPGLIVNGNIFGGGRMANVGGNTEIVIVNCDSIGGIYGGNDIAGAVQGSNGAKITLGVNADNVNGYDVQYGTTPANVTLKFGDVYGGGNGYYAYDGSSFEAASANYTSYTVQPGESVKAMTQSHQVGDIVWTNTGSASVTLDFPSIVKTEILVSDNYVTADSIFGGAKNAFLTTNSGDGSLITIDGGTIMAVFGGNNFGGKQGYGQHHIVVNKTTTSLTPSINNTATTGYGRDFGIRYLFGGGNKVYGSTTNVEIFGGQCDTIFAGGNSADVYAANVTVNCEMQASSTDFTYGNVYSNAINTYAGGTITPKDDYGWNGFGGIYNVRTLFGGNNMATFDSQQHETVPSITLTSGSLGTVYGGGNSGDMWGYDATTINGETVNYGTHVKMENQTVLVDYLYGGCQMSNVRYSTWVQILDGHVGTVYGGCNISGDVGSTRVNMNAPSHIGEDPNPAYQVVYGGTFVEASGGTVYNNLFGGGNGFYHCLNDEGYYTSQLSYTDHDYSGLASPTHNETHVVVNTGATIKGNVYAGGNLACVGFSNNTALVNDDQFPRYVGLSSVRMSGGHVYGNVYGGCNMSNVYGSNEVQVSGGTIDESLYGGNDRLGTVATPISNRVLPPEYQIASDNITSLVDPKVYTYVGLTGNPSITNVYGGGNGDYYYCTSDAAAQAYLAGGGEKEPVVSCDISNEPIQQCTFVDIGVNGGDADGAHIGTVYGGGDGVTVTGFAKVFLNVKTDPIGYSNVGTIFGGNNKGDLLLVPDIILLNGQVNTVYGGCNMGAMTAGSDENAPTRTIVGAHGDTFEDVGSYVHLLASYDGDGEGGHAAVTPNIKVMDAIYGGCRMNGVTNNSLVLVEGSDFSNMTKGLFGGSDISGTVSGKSMVAVTGGTVGNVYGGGNGNYDYTSGDYSGLTAPICAQSGADILGGSVGTAALLGDRTVSKVFGGGYGPGTQTTGNVVVNVGYANAANASGTPTIYGEIYGGSAFGTVNSSASNSTTVNFLNGTMKKATVNNVDYGGNVFGGGLGDAGDASKGQVNGKVYVYISNDTQDPDNCFIDLRQANVYGCNNTNGSPQDDVTVHVYKTAYNFSDYTSGNHYTSQEGEDPYYAINQVFGGGNQADYAPNGGNVNSTKKTLVYVHDCSNTIRRVFAGGNAAAATGVSAIIEGGRFDYIFGGGNGEVERANIGLGGTNTTLSAGFVNHLFGGSNMRGEITGPVNTLVSGDHVVQPGGVGIPCGENITEFFGGSNEANLNANVTTVVECGTGMVGTLYGGCNKADIEGDVTLTVRGGQYDYVYGGSKGIASNGADITGNVTLNLEGGTIGDHTGGTSGNEFGGAFGGSNVRGNITGSIIVNVIDIEQCPLDVTNIYGAGNQADYTPTDPTITSPVVNVMHLKPIENGLGIRKNVFGGGNEAVVTANPQVNIGYDATSMSSIITALGISTGLLTNFPHVLVTGSVFGGGNVAQVDGSITVNVYNGEIVHKLVGGGNNLGFTGPNDINVGVTGNVVVNISGGQLCTEPTGDGAGVYGGCNESGIVNGDITLNITGSTASPANQTTIGTEAALNVAAAGVPDPGDPVSIHGGGFGEYTRTNGNVTINYGFDDGSDDSECIYPMLYGDLYGGSALGTVNDAASDKTTVNVCNGSLQYVTTMYGTPVAKEYQYGGNIYGGGLGRKADPANSITAAVADVNGVVYVKIGADAVAPSTKPTGKAHLKGCNVFGGNNTNGSPQQNVYVDVYQTAHEENDSVNFGEDHWYNYAIRNVYGGGNQSHYHPASNEGFLKKAHNSIHYCNNTIEYVYGGGNAAWTDGTVVSVDGGRFKFIFGGGNGQSGIGADILDGGVNISIYGGHVGWYFSGCNLHGNIGGGAPVEQYGCTAEYCPCGDELVVERYYFGANEALTVGGLTHKINCGDNMNFKYVYAGSRLAQVYGDIKLWVRGGNIANLFGGSEGSNEVSADVLRYPTEAEVQAAQPGDYPQAVLDYLEEHHDQYGQGGNIFLILEGGTLHKVYGGNDYRGNVEGNITVFVDDAMSTECPLTIDTLYGGNRLAGYEPLDGSTRISPIVYLKNGRVEEDVFGGSLGGNSTHPYGNGIVKSNPLVVIGDDGNEPKAEVGRDVFGGGSAGEMIGSPRVVLQGKATIENNVFGGSKQSTVDGNTDVAIASTTPIITVPETPVPPTHKFYIRVVQPEGAGCSVSVTDNPGNPVLSGADVLEGEALHLQATAPDGYTFVEWSVGDEPGGGTLTNPTSTSSIYYMGTRDVTLTATFTARGRHNER